MIFYRLAQAFGKEFGDNIGDLLDKYLMIRFDHDNYFYFNYKARDTLLGLYEEIKKLPKVETQNMTSIHRNLVRSIDEIIQLRREIIVTGSITVSFLQWSSIILLGGILISTLYYLKNATLYSSIITGLLSFAVLLFLGGRLRILGLLRLRIPTTDDSQAGGEQDRQCDRNECPHVSPPGKTPQIPIPKIGLQVAQYRDADTGVKHNIRFCDSTVSNRSSRPPFAEVSGCSAFEVRVSSVYA